MWHLPVLLFRFGYFQQYATCNAGPLPQLTLLVGNFFCHKLYCGSNSEQPCGFIHRDQWTMITRLQPQ